MIYVATIEHYEEWDGKVKPCSMFICADTIVQAVQQVSDYYGEQTIESVEVRPFSPDNFLSFNEEDAELFHTVKHHLEEDIVW